MYENTTNQLSNFRTKTGVKINDDACGMSNTHIQIKFKSTMLKTSLCDYCGAQMLAKGAIQQPQMLIQIIQIKRNVWKLSSIYWLYERNKQSQVDNSEDIDLVMSMHN